MRDEFLRILESQSNINGRYTNLQRIGPKGGDGAFSILVSAQDQVIGRPVALKFFDPTKRHDAYRIACFERESKVLKRLSGQEHILQLVYEVSDFTCILTDRNTGLSFPV